MHYKELRKKYPEFVYKSFEYKLADGDLVCDFLYDIGPNLNFKHTVVVKKVAKLTLDKLNPEILDNLIFHIGLVEMPSYWKITCSPLIKIEAGKLNEDQIVWWEKIFRNGMMQYFYTNKIDFREENFLTIESTENLEEKEITRYVNNDSKIRPLVTVGGGKDSAVTLGMIDSEFQDYGALVIKPASDSAYKVLEVAETNNVITAQRLIDRKIIELNNSGYLNGHIPFSAVLYFISLLSAFVFNYSDILFSNENSSNEGNTEYLRKIVNHQYSKTLEFENDFRDYNQRYLSNIRLFSFLRPIYEIQISKLFAEMPQYFKVIRSCNVGQQKGIWCGKCPKCLSTYILLEPFLGEAKTIEIFGHNLLKDKTNKPLLKQLTDVNEVKPLECVGTREELKIALTKDVSKNEIMKFWGENNLPEKFATILRAHLSNV